MGRAKNKRKRFRKRLVNEYRLVVLNENTFEEKISFKLTPLNTFVFITLFITLLIAGTTLLIAFTPLREYIPGYSSATLRKRTAELAYKTDSLTEVLNYNNQYLDTLKKVLRGEIKSERINKDSLFQQFKTETPVTEVPPSKQDLLLREQVSSEDKYNVFDKGAIKGAFVLYPPVQGTITQNYNPKEKHFAVDVVTAKNAPVKAAAEGTVIFAEWTAATGYTLIIEHPFNLISVYKHNASLIKQQGDLVKAGEVIAIVGNTGEITTGPHLHFELWSEGYPVNPVYYIDFE
jgi:murein DD-endopeptidase MepM/ murein hydrolase activator NlpD